MPETKIKIESVREASEYLARPRNEDTTSMQKNYHRKQNEIKDFVQDFRIRYRPITPLKDTDGSDGGEFYGLCGNYEQNKERWQKEMEIEIEGGGISILTVLIRKNGKKRK